MRRFQVVIEKIDELLASDKAHVLVAIDGKLDSGKSTLAGHLQYRYHCTVFHMSDFPLRESQMSEERLAEVGGDVDYERFKDQVIDPLLNGDDIIHYMPYNTRTHTWQGETLYAPTRLVVVEGTYSAHPHFGDPYDLVVFMDVESEIQKENVHRRFGKRKAEAMEQGGYAREEAYFKAVGLCEHALVLPWESID